MAKFFLDLARAWQARALARACQARACQAYAWARAQAGAQARAQAFCILHPHLPYSLHLGKLI